MLRLIISSIAFIVLVSTASAQKQTDHLEQVWGGYFNQTRFNKHWGLWVDLHLRTRKDFFTDFSQSISRFGLTYYLSDKIKLTGGYAYINIFPADNHANVSVPEHRPWQQLQWHTNSSKLRIMQWIRLEERFRHKIKNNNELADGYNFNYRVRYNFFLSFPLGKRPFEKNTLSAVINDELHINAGKEITYNTFDQNRFFIGFAYHVNAHDNLQFGYMNVYQQLASGNRYRLIHVPRVFYFHNLDLRKSR